MEKIRPESEQAKKWLRQIEGDQHSQNPDCSLEVRTWWWIVGNELVYFGMKTGVERSGLEQV